MIALNDADHSAQGFETRLVYSRVTVRQPVDEDLGFDCFELGIPRHHARMASAGERDAECVCVRDGELRFEMCGVKDQRAIRGHHPNRQLVDDSDGALCLMESLLALDNVQTLTVGNQ
ncbi:MAG TPA: hypothetical protein VEU08_19610 [Vicinamibacterales bacterium]|nr:hypothetical protein [Vicinamibacterales bacterium]